MDHDRGADRDRGHALDSVPVAVVVLERDTRRILELNRAAARLYGYPPSRLRGRDSSILREPGTPSAFPDLRAIPLDGSRRSHGWVHVTRSGEPLVVDLQAQATSWDGTPAIVVTVLPRRDAVDAGGGALDRALDAADVAVVVLSAGEGLVRAWSPAAERIFGYHEDDVLGRPDPAVLPRDHSPDAASERSAVLDGDWVIASEVRRTRSDGRLVDLLLTVAPLGTAGGEERLVALVVDITARKRLEARLDRAERLEAIGRFAGAIAHDFNNVLTAVSGFASLLAESTPADDPRSQEADEIIGAARRGQALTDQLLTFAKRQAARPTVVSPNTVIQEMARMLERLLGPSVALTLGLDLGVGEVVVDRSRLEQVVMNLAVNARDAMPEGGAVLLETASVVLDTAYAESHPGTVPGQYVMLGVSDQGVGIPAEALPSVFEPFFTTKGGKGTGLGLSTVYGIVRQAGGHIDVYSEPGFGTTFRVYLPAYAERVVASVTLSDDVPVEA